MEHNLSVSARVAHFNAQLRQHEQLQKSNPFTHVNVCLVAKRRFNKDEYGKPPPGSRSACRALEAKVQMNNEILQLCELLHDNQPNYDCEIKLNEMTFAKLFEIYSHISDKLVGTLLRARRCKLIDFTGEMLYQGRDDQVLISLAKPINAIRQELLLELKQLNCQLTEQQNHFKAMQNY